MLTINDFIPKTREMISLLKQLVEIESPSGNKAAVDRMAEFVQAQAVRLGGRVTVEKQPTSGNHVVARWGEGTGGILTLCHMDTVHPLGTLSHFPCAERDGKLYGPGTMDMKASIAVLLAAIQALQQQGQMPSHPITALFTADEEVGSHTSRPLIEALARQAELVMCMEPALPDGSLKTSRKGVGDFELLVHGVASHAGADHEKGRNAIEELAYQVLAIQRMTDYSKGTTLNVGIIHGGTASNVVPAEARAEIDLRVMQPGEAERVTQALLALKPVLEGTSLEVSGGLNRPPMPRDERMARAFQHARELGARLGLDLKERGTGGGSDANFVAPLGVPVLDGLGPVGDGEHSEREYIEIASLPERAALLAALLQGWFD